MNALKNPELNVVVAGNGSIGSAITEALLRDYPVEKLFILARNPVVAAGDDRVMAFPVDALDEQTLGLAVEQIANQTDRLHLVINTVGILHGPGFAPEKRLADLSTENLERSMRVNAWFAAALASTLGGLLKHSEPALFASLSARVGSIEDNGMGGWYGYRASKAAHNMLLRTLAREWRLSHKHVTVLALHPGTVESGLSRPFISARYARQVLTPTASAEALLAVMGGTTVADSGTFLDWRGEAIPW